MKDLDFMARAIELAKKGQLNVQPNPMVGCVIVKNNKIIGEGWHKEYGKDHADLSQAWAFLLAMISPPLIFKLTAICPLSISETIANFC